MLGLGLSVIGGRLPLGAGPAPQSWIVSGETIVQSPSAPPAPTASGSTITG